VLTAGVLDGMQSALNPQGTESAIIAEMAWVLIAGAALVFAVVMAIAAYAVFAPRDRARRLSQRALLIGGGIVFPTIVLASLLLYSLLRAASLAAPGDGAALRIEVTGEQWWWRVQYLDEAGRVDFVTANEIHIPAGRAVDLTLRSADVIHSFWVPALAGKLDMVPGKVNRMRITAQAPGVFRGQCAEYCGGPHGFMAFLVVAQAQPEFAAWATRQRAPAAAGSDVHADGAALFQSMCAACHAVRGTPATGTRGPDLTHVGSRRTLGAVRVNADAQALADWIAKNQHLKPGNLMPQFTQLSGAELRALADYLESLR
jgi:cytochrome c oxidase subunit 2